MGKHPALEAVELAVLPQDTADSNNRGIQTGMLYRVGVTKEICLPIMKEWYCCKDNR